MRGKALNSLYSVQHIRNLTKRTNQREKQHKLDNIKLLFTHKRRINAR